MQAAGEERPLTDLQTHARASLLASTQERGILKVGEDVEVQKNAACSLFSERNPLPLERRSFGSFSVAGDRK